MTSRGRVAEHQRYVATEALGGGMRALEASAGTGKTHAITSNVLRLVVERDEPLEMDRLLLVTFTRAATAELEDRVRRRLVEGQQALTRAAVLDDHQPDDEVLRAVVDHAREHGLDEARHRVEEALRTVDQATVTTIHGFCHQVLRQAAVHTDSDPAVRVDTDDDRLVRAVVDDWMVRFTHDADEELVALLDELKLGRDGLHAVGRVVAGEPDPQLAPDRPADDLDPLAEIAAARRRLRAALDDPADTLAASRRLYDDGRITGHSTWSPTDAKLPRRIADLRTALDADEVGRDELKYLDPQGTRGDGSRPMPPEIAATSVPRAVAGLTETRARVETWIRRTLADDVRAELQRRREAAGTASFADLLRRLDAALDQPGGDVVVAEVGSQYDAVLVDEFQDTDPVQWSILRRLFTGTEVFHVVGDPKQAIYGWRGADLATYLGALEDAGDRTRTMTTNWRSDRAYVAALNHLLGPDDSLGGTVAYVEVEPAPGRDGRLRDADGADAAGLHVTYLPGLGTSNVANVRDAIAQDVAQDVVDTLASELTLPGDEGQERRSLVAADCAVLVRRHTEAAAVAAALRARDVPVVVGGGDDVLLSGEADAMADLLRVLVAPGDDRALRRLLVGPFVGLDANELEGLTDAAWQDHAVAARRWAATWATHGVAAAVQRAIREGEAEWRHARTREGDRTMTNLRHLTELLHRAEQEEALGTHALAAWFDARRAEAEQEVTPPERELRLERDDAAVRVLTVHAAKGLEFPLVWVPFLWTREGLGRDTPAPFVVNDPAQEHVRTVSLHAASSRAIRELDDDRRRLRRAHEVAEWEGGLRLAYVALTRAEHRCTVHLCNYDHQGSLVASPAWQLFWRGLGDGRPHATDPPPHGAHEDEDELRHRLRDLGEHPAIEVETDPPLRPLEPHRGEDAVADGTLVAREYDREEPLDVAWGRASFTGLLRGRVAAAPEEADAGDEVDTDQAVPVDGHGLPPLPVEVCATEPDVPLAPLPRGAGWGTFLHDVLEHAEFGAALEDLHELVVDRARWAPVRPGTDDVEVAARGLHAALRTPLGPALGELRLRDVTRRDRLDELGFTLTLGEDAASSFDVGSLADVLRDHAADADAPLAAAADHLRRGGTGRRVHGLLVGSIDLVVRHEERFWIADYKSNGLGQWLDTDAGGRWCETEAHTGPDRVARAMLAGDYLLQAHLYVVALHRYLRGRLGEGYDYDRHVGGWAYLFLRGMTGEDVRRTDGLPHGVATGRPTRALVEDLDGVLRGS